MRPYICISRTCSSFREILVCPDNKKFHCKFSVFNFGWKNFTPRPLMHVALFVIMHTQMCTIYSVMSVNIIYFWSPTSGWTQATIEKKTQKLTDSSQKIYQKNAHMDACAHTHIHTHAILILILWTKQNRRKPSKDDSSSLLRFIHADIYKLR